MIGIISVNKYDFTCVLLIGQFFVIAELNTAGQNVAWGPYVQEHDTYIAHLLRRRENPTPFDVKVAILFSWWGKENSTHFYTQEKPLRFISP